MLLTPNELIDHFEIKPWEPYTHILHDTDLKTEIETMELLRRANDNMVNVLPPEVAFEIYKNLPYL